MCDGCEEVKLAVLDPGRIYAASVHWKIKSGRKDISKYLIEIQAKEKAPGSSWRTVARVEELARPPGKWYSRALPVDWTGCAARSATVRAAVLVKCLDCTTSGWVLSNEVQLVPEISGTALIVIMVIFILMTF